MPDAEDRQAADNATRQRIIDALIKKQGGEDTLRCTLCGSNEWTVGLFSAIPVSFSATKLNVLSGKVYPMATIICANCGNTHFVNLQFLGFDEAQRGELVYTEPSGEQSDA